MADHLTDANILIRLSNVNDPQYHPAENALNRLKQRGHNLCLVPQCCYEYWSVATRPATSRGGLGLTPAEAETELARFLTNFVSATRYFGIIR